ncbi:MAG: agmatine/peptidylarginine deiminase, partial [Myxococcota bacterium]
MYMLKLITLSFLAFTLAACASSEVSGPSDANNNGASLLPKPMLPAHALPGERNGAGKGDQFDDFRLANTDIYGITAAPQTPLRAVAQWDDHQALLLTWTGSFPDVMANIVQASKNQIDIYVVHEGNFAKQQFQSALQDNGVSSAGLNYFNMDTDSIWMRDYGPLSVRAPDGTVAFVDPRYYHQRVFDDALPTKIGNEFGINIYRQPLQWEGGTYIADGKGNCIYSQGVYQFGGTSQEKIHTYQKDYLGCTTNIVIKPLAQEGTTHSDMFAKMYAPNKVLLGDYQSWQDSGNAQILDDNEAILESAVSATGTALEVTRLPMPSNSGRTVWRTYANSLFVNGTNLVPIYSDDTQFQAAAMGVWQSIMPSWNHVMIDSTELITWSGAIHCITMTVPSGSLSKVEADPPFLCAGDFDCFPSSTGVGSCAFEGCCDGSTLNTCNASGATTQACGGQGCGWSDATMSYQCGGSGGGPIAAAPLSCGATCTPSCTGSACGSDGCGGSCGACASGETCVSGQCEAPDDPCGGISFQGCCEGNTLKYCDNGQAQSVSCNDGCGWQSGQGWYNCGFTGTDPTGANPKACASECTPDCSGKTCGDDGCGGSCGSCSGGQTCTGGQCECVADCSGKLCGGDGCGGSCGTCAGGSSCSTSGQCVDDCAPDCSGKACGTDGCGGTCGTCDAGATCTATGQCQAAQGCGDLTFDGKCEGNTLIWCQDETINDFECSELGAFECKAEPGTTPPNHDCLPVEGGCTAECTGKVCGSDGCGGVCGNCGDGESCVDGACEGGTTDPCNGLTWEGCCADGTLNYCGGGQPQTVNCGNNGCGWNADQGYYDCNFSEDGPAEFPKACGATACEPSCAGNVCGSDGCGGSCGTCTGGLSCEAGQCMDACQSIPFEGACEGTTLSFCEGGAVESGDCAQFGGCCGWNGAQNYFDCLEGDACTGCVDACAAGDGGCNEGATHAWTCQSAADGCLAPAYVTCVDGCDAATGQCSDDGPPPCTASCDNKQCGDDGCGASCGACLAGESCNASGQCVSGCNPSCDG